LAAATATPLRAQTHDHAAHAASRTAGAAPTREGGQAAFAAIAEVVRVLDADPATDWSRVDLEALRQHLIDMDRLILHAAVRTEALPDGARFTVTGDARTAAAIGRMVPMHADALESERPWTARVQARPDGAVLEVVARTPGDAREAARIRGLGFVGVMATGEHHAAHHLAIARGAAMHGLHH
jgi:hypothetical protein